MKTQRTDMTEEEIKRAEDLGICTLTPEEMQQDAWERTAVGKYVSLDTLPILVIAVVVLWAFLPSLLKKAKE